MPGVLLDYPNERSGIVYCSSKEISVFGILQFLFDRKSDKNVDFLD